MTEERKILKREIGERLRKALKAKGVKFGDVAKDLEVNPSSLSLWCKGQKDPGFSKIALMTQKYGVNPLFLITGEGPPILPMDGKREALATIRSGGKKKLLRRRSVSGRSISSSASY